MRYKYARNDFTGKYQVYDVVRRSYGADFKTAGLASALCSKLNKKDAVDPIRVVSRSSIPVGGGVREVVEVRMSWQPDVELVSSLVGKNYQGYGAWDTKVTKFEHTTDFWKVEWTRSRSCD